jgi:hypothetical protein
MHFSNFFKMSLKRFERGVCGHRVPSDPSARARSTISLASFTMALK